MRLKDKVAIITGGAVGIGKSFAEGFTGEGAKVVIADINITAASQVAESLNKQGGDAIAIKTDVTQVKDTEEMAKKTVERYGRVEILVNNAAVFMRPALVRTPLHQMAPEEWDRVIAVNLRGVFLCSRAVIPQMIKQGGGKIINMASSLAFTGAPSMVHYVTTKGGVVGFTRALAKELGEHMINVNAIGPGSTMSEEPTDAARDRRKYDGNMRCLKRIETPADLVGAAIFLASNESDFMTGQTLVVDGGVAMH